MPFLMDKHNISQCRTLRFNEFVRRANEKKHTDYYLNSVSAFCYCKQITLHSNFSLQEEMYYLRSLGDNPRKVLQWNL